MEMTLVKSLRKISVLFVGVRIQIRIHNTGTNCAFILLLLDDNKYEYRPTFSRLFAALQLLTFSKNRRVAASSSWLNSDDGDIPRVLAVISAPGTPEDAVNSAAGTIVATAAIFVPVSSCLRLVAISYPHAKRLSFTWWDELSF